MAYPKIFHPCFLVIFLILSHLLHLPATEATNDGFSVKLIRRNSLSAPSHQSLTTNYYKSYAAAHATINAYDIQHLMELSIGTPPVKFYGITDTGSDLIWTQCLPCSGCFTQPNPLFDPRKSSSYCEIPCNSGQCQMLLHTQCSPQKRCGYTYGYADNFTTQGTLAQETVTITSATGNPLPLKGIVFGCAHNRGILNDPEKGIIGLARGPGSLISQISPLVGGNKFSQCLVPFNTDMSVSSIMSFGKGSEVSGAGVVSTPLVVRDETYSYYLVTLLGISVGDTYLRFDSSPAKGNMLIDSGTHPIYLPQQFYDQVVAEVKKKVALEPIRDDPLLGSKICYQTRTNLNGPLLTAHFEGADIPLTPTQTFTIAKDGVYCLAITSTSGGRGTYGNSAQSNYLIGFDLERQVVSFKPMDCTKQ
ncbi:Xylanase inhibitor, C-terminal [Sesbania bispinosa]|nr:Xylanase inhibitor, C-terminal [Sesbania bispinosa]